MKKVLIYNLCLWLGYLSYGQVNKLHRQAANASDLNEKIEIYSKIIELDPENLDAYFYRGLAKNDLGDYSGAIVDYSKIIVLEPDADTYYNRGNSRYSNKDFLGALDDYHKAYKLNPDFLDALYSLGCVKYDLGDFEGALADFNILIKRLPNQQKFYYQRALTLIAIDKPLLALNDYSLAILIDQNADSYYRRGVLYMDINYYEKAHADLSASLKLNENNSYAYFYRGAASLMLGKYLDAITDFNTVLKFDSLDFDAMLGLSICYFKINDKKNAELFFNKARSILAFQNNTIDVNDFKNTYWFQNQYFFFNENLTELSNFLK